MSVLFCYGDSNTWGYDPRAPFGEQYAHPWCDILSEKYALSVINAGENGRTIPAAAWEYRILGQQLNQHPECSTILIMLGTNDILRGCSAAADKMEALLDFLRRDFPHIRPVLLAPPQIEISEFAEEASALAQKYAQIAAARCIRFHNTQKWHLPLAYDGIHLSEEGHGLFAARIAEIL